VVPPRIGEVHAGRSARRRAFDQHESILICRCQAFALSRAAAQEAESAANRLSYPFSGYMGEEDALRHCMWSCMMARLLGSSAATTVGTTHENCNPSLPLDRSMDMINNAVGVGLGVSAPAGADCGLMCVAALDSGRLTVRLPSIQRGTRAHP